MLRKRPLGGRGLCGFRVGVVTLCALALPIVAVAEFGEPLHRLTDFDGGAKETVMGLGPSNNVHIATVSDSRVQVDIIGPNLEVSFPVLQGGREVRDPDVAVNLFGQTFVSFGQLGPEGREGVYLASNRGPEFTAPRRVSDSLVRSRHPRLSLALSGRPHLVWSAGEGTPLTPERVLYYNDILGETQDLTLGTKPDLFLDAEDVAHVVFFRSERLFYTNNFSGEFGREELAAMVPTSEGTTVRVGLDRGGNLFIAYTSGGSLYLVSRRAGAEDFSAPVLLDSGDIANPKLQVRPDGSLSIVYAFQGDVHIIQGSIDSLSSPARLMEGTPDAESDPSFIEDRCGTMHIAFVRSGEAFYVNNAETPSPEFTADVERGEAPLTVQFRDASTGKVQARIWDFGDGHMSTAPNPRHTFTRPGTYTVSMTAFTADRQSTAVKDNFIVVSQPRNVMEIPDNVVVPGQTGVWFPVRGSYAAPIQGFQVHAVFDSNSFELEECSLEYTVTGPVEPEIWECNVFNTSVEIGAIFEFEKPIIMPELPSASRQTLVNLVFDVRQRAPGGTQSDIELVNDPDLSPIFNIYIVDGVARIPFLRSSTVTILSPEDPLPAMFQRGDADSSGEVDITDAIVILNFLFLGGEQPSCMDGADFWDSGDVNITSAISLFSFLFLGGAAPYPPFPNAGFDPQPDELPECDI